MTCVKVLSSMAFGVVGVLAILSPAAASVYDEAKKVCLERYTEEQAGNTVPAGMSKAGYLRQCQASYVRTAASDLSFEDSDVTKVTKDKNGQGGPEILPPGTTILKAAPKKSMVPTPRFKPTI